MYTIIAHNFKAITSLTIMLLMGLALFTGPANARSEQSGLTDQAASSGGHSVPAIPIEISIRHNGE
jgi:hypothetical protein